MNQLLRFGLILGVICLAATLVLAVTYHITKPEIDKKLREEEQEALMLIIPEADFFRERSSDGFEYFEAVKGQDTIGYCIRITTNGYNGFIRMVAGIDPNGIIKGVEVLQHEETPGLGGKVDEVRPGEKESSFLMQFRGKQARTIAVKKDIDAITGATITSRAVTDSINKTVNEFLSKVKR
jgi:electron transport complex protein RnfG